MIVRRGGQTERIAQAVRADYALKEAPTAMNRRTFLINAGALAIAGGIAAVAPVEVSEAKTHIYTGLVSGVAVGGNDPVAQCLFFRSQPPGFLIQMRFLLLLLPDLIGKRVQFPFDLLGILHIRILCIRQGGGHQQQDDKHHRRRHAARDCVRAMAVALPILRWRGRLHP